jgi:hypothetical protein
MGTGKGRAPAEEMQVTLSLGRLPRAPDKPSQHLPVALQRVAPENSQELVLARVQGAGKDLTWAGEVGCWVRGLGLSCLMLRLCLRVGKGRVLSS